MLSTHDAGIRLRPVHLPDDIAPAVAWYQDPEVLHHSQGDSATPFNAAMVEKMYSAMATRCEVYVVEFRDKDGWRAVGDASLCQEAGTPIVIGDARDRSRGIGRIVLARLVERARELGWPEMVVSGIFTDNPRARRLYEGAGFRITGEIPAGNGRTQWTMSLQLNGDGPHPGQQKS
jgi:RimJ/RimL family protein N-acetyltransferase